MRTSDWTLESFDKAFEIALLQLGVSSPVILGLVALAFKIDSWRAPILAGKRAAGWTARQVVLRFQALGLPAVITASTLTAIVLLAQLANIGVSYVVGNLFSILFHLPPSEIEFGAEATTPAGQRLIALSVVWTEGGVWASLSPRLFALLELDVLSGAVVLIATIAVASSYRPVRRSSLPPYILGSIMAFPLSAWFYVALFLLIRSLFSRDEQVGSFNILLVNVLACGIYYATCLLSISASRYVVKAWSGS